MARKPQVYVVVKSWKDRHGDEGVYTEVFGKRKSANEHLTDDIKTYLEIHDGITDDGAMNTESLTSFEAWDINSEECTLAEFQKAAAKAGHAEVNVDGDGTYATWSVSKQTVH
jgi:hypothetical protein